MARILLLVCLFLLEIKTNTFAQMPGNLDIGYPPCFLYISWSDLGNYMNSSYAPVRPVECLIITTDHEIPLTSKLYIEGLVFKINLTTDSVFEIFLSVLTGIKGLSVHPWTNRFVHNPYLSAFLGQQTLALAQSYVELVLDSSTPISSCSYNMLSERESNRTIFNFFRDISFNNDVKYSPKPVCPFIFKNALLRALRIGGLCDSFSLQNLWRFRSVGPGVSSINSRIDHVLLYGYNFRVDETILNPLVFELTTSIQIRSRVKSIDTSVFKALGHVNTVRLRLESLGDLFHKVGIDWVSHLPDGTKVIFSDPAMEIETDSYLYKFPDRDFCIFSKFPFERRLVPVLDTSRLRLCTNTIVWLTRNQTSSLKYYEFCDAMNAEFMHSFFNKCQTMYPFNETFFGHQKKMCELNKRQVDDTEYLDWYDVIYSLEYAESLVIFIFIPLASIIGFFLNYLIIRTVKKHEKTELQEEFYKYMSLNSIFNCLYCLVYCFYPINYCTDYFCSPFYKLIFVQYIKIVFISYFGEAIKTCANISYILITINRYMLIGREHVKILKRISTLKYKTAVSFTVVFSFLFNLGYCFLFEINSKVRVYFLVLFEQYHFSTGHYPDLNVESLLYGIFSMTYFVVNSVLFLVTNTIVEIIMLVKFHRELVEKRHRMEQMEVIDQAMRKKIEQGFLNEKRAIRMVVLNGSLNFLLRVPEISIFLQDSPLLGYIKRAKYFTLLDSYPFLLSMLIDLSYLFYICTFSTNFMIYYMFNKRFEQAVHSWFLRNKNQPN
jgi:hypothetical protein